jgi:monothiol glutaredoxin
MENSELIIDEQVEANNATTTIENQIKENSILIYMKGNALLPQCGFSAQVIEIFNRLGVRYKTFNVLAHFEIREAIKKFSNWPTIPQIYHNGEFLGGCDIIIEMYQSGELAKRFGVE